MGPWKHSKEKMNIFLEDAKVGQEMVENVLRKNEAKEKIVQKSSQERAEVSAEVITSQKNIVPEQTQDVENVKIFLASLPEETKKVLGDLRYNTWSGEDLA